MNNKLKILDLFSGCGGLSLGFEEAGYEVIAGIDHWNDAMKTFKHNHKNAIGIVADLYSKEPKEIAELVKLQKIDVIVGGPPCQGFSIAGKRLIEDDRNKLYKSFVTFVEFFKPKAFVLENVPNILTMGEGQVKASIIHDFESLGYTVVSKVLMASKYGVPQNRKRAFFVGLLDNLTFNFPEQTSDVLITSSEAISDLTESTSENGHPYNFPPQSDYQEKMRQFSEGVFNHEITNHSEQTINIISQVPDGGNYKNLPDTLKKTRNVNIAWTRLNSEKPSFTIDTGHRHHFHYIYNRIPTVRESARIQSFPDNFIFLGSKTSQYKQVGNAVPPLLAKTIAEELKKML